MIGLKALTMSFPWTRYSKKLCANIETLRFTGFFTPQEAEARDLHLAIGAEGSVKNANAVTLFWLVDRDDGMIVDAKFQVYGPSVLIGAAEIACDIIIGKNYDQAKRITTILIDKHGRDRPNTEAFPQEANMHLNLILTAIDAAAETCSLIPFADTYVAAPVPRDIGEVVPGGYPGWIELPLKKKIAVIEQILDQDVRPYIALDGGGISILNLLNDQELVISYHGSCTSCYSSIGTTLSYIQQIVRAKVHPDLNVVPDLNTTPS